MSTHHSITAFLVIEMVSVFSMLKLYFPSSNIAFSWAICPQCLFYQHTITPLLLFPLLFIPNCVNSVYASLFIIRYSMGRFHPVSTITHASIIMACTGLLHSSNCPPLLFFQIMYYLARICSLLRVFCCLLLLLQCNQEHYPQLDSLTNHHTTQEIPFIYVDCFHFSIFVSISLFSSVLIVIPSSFLEYVFEINSEYKVARGLGEERHLLSWPTHLCGHPDTNRQTDKCSREEKNFIE